MFQMINHSLINQKLVHSFLDTLLTSSPIPLIGAKRIWHHIQKEKFPHQTSEIRSHTINSRLLSPNIFPPHRKIKIPRND